MKRSLLDIVQEVLIDLDSDEVNSINDTVESLQVANIVRACYLEMTSNRNWPDQKKLIQISASNDLNKPNYMRLPDGIKEVVQVLYNKAKDGETKLVYQPVKFVYPDEFLRLVNSRNTDLDNVIVVSDFSGIQIPVVNSQPPSYWTSFDDNWLVFDAYDSTVDDTLKSSKSEVIAYVEKIWVHDDDAIPDLPSEAFSALVEESKSTAFLALKQMPNEKAEMKSQRQQRWLSRKAWRAQGGIRYPDYGRNSRK
jgi:hypothetical protein